MEARISLAGGMRFVGTADSGHTLAMDASEKVGGNDSAPRPSELLLLGLGGCTAMDVISILRKKRQTVTDFEVVVRGEQATGYPANFTHISIEFLIKGENIDPEAVRRAIELSETKYCSVGATLQKSVSISSRFRITASEGDSAISGTAD